MNRHTEIKDIEHRIRSSMAYHDWVERNRGFACITCDASDELQVHHITELYHIILGLWKLYGDPDMIVAHAQAIHIDDHCEAITLCKACHNKLHPGRRIVISTKDIRIEDWCAIPRHLPGKLISHPLQAKEPGLTLVGAQLLCGLGWFILNGHLDSRILEFKRSTMANLIGKKPGTSFNASLERALDSLIELDVVLAWHISGPSVEVHMERAYLDTLSELPWFMGMQDVQTTRMPVFTLRWFLSLQSGRRTYKIGKTLLPKHLYLNTTTPAFVCRSVKNACKYTDWATVNYDGEFFEFKMKRRGAVPIWSLRSLVRDAIQEGC